MFTILFLLPLLSAVPLNYETPQLKSITLDTNSTSPNTTQISYLEISTVSAFENYFTSYNSTTLSSANEPPLQIYIAETKEVCTNNRNLDKQYCVKLTSHSDTYRDPIGAPLTACLDSRLGEGGSTSKSFSVGVSVSPGFTVGLSDSAVTLLSLSSSVSISKSVSFGLSDSCSVTKGNIVQMWGYPFYTVGNVKYRTFEYSRIRGRKVKWSEWSDEKEVTFASGVSPATRCIGSVTEEICGQTPVKRKFVVPGQPLVDDM